jgi:predicted secreted protein
MACTRSLLNALLDGAAQLPQITVVRRPREAAVEAPGEDPDLVRLTQRLGRAAGILRQKRERLH